MTSPDFSLIGFQPKAAVGSCSREDHTDGARAVLLCQGMQQKVEGQARAVTRLRLREVQGAVGDRQIGSRRNDIEVLALDQHSIGCLPHGHRRVAGQQIHHHAFMGRIEMLDEDEGHAVAGAQGPHELPAGIKATRRGAYSDDGKVPEAARRATRRQDTPARSRPGRFGLMRKAFWHSVVVLKKALPNRKRRPIVPHFPRRGDVRAA